MANSMCRKVAVTIIDMPSRQISQMTSHKKNKIANNYFD